MKIVFLFDGNFEVGGQVFHFAKGEVAEVPEKDARRLIDGLCAELYIVKPIKEAKHERKNKQQMD